MIAQAVFAEFRIEAQENIRNYITNNFDLHQENVNFFSEENRQAFVTAGCPAQLWNDILASLLPNDENSIKGAMWDIFGSVIGHIEHHPEILGNDLPLIAE